MAIAKIILNGVVQMDVTGDTVASGNLLSGYTATGNDGQTVNGSYVAPVLGTKSITANGTYNASDDSLGGYSSVSVNVSGGGGSEIESGTVTIASDTHDIQVTFSNAHSSPPIFINVCVDDHVQQYYSTTYTAYAYTFTSTVGIVGGEYYGGSDGSNPVFGYIARTQRTNVSNTLTSGCVGVSTTPDFVSNTGFTASTTSTTYWRANTYKWIAVWKPTT